MSKPDIFKIIEDLEKQHLIQAFRGDTGELCISLTEDSKKKTFTLKTSEWDRWLIRFFRKIKIDASTHLRDAITDELCASAEIADKKNVCVRVANTGIAIQIDLNDDTYDVVYISTSGNGFKLRPPKDANFIRPYKQHPLPRPIRCKREDFVKAFKKLMPEFEQGHWLLILTFILKSLNRDQGSYVILVIEGPKGSGKTTFTRIIKALVDPSKPTFLSVPKNDEDFIVSARNAYLLTYDNLSGIGPDIADTFCRLATGGGINKRQLYSNHDEAFYELHRPILINGIDEPSNRADFLDRCVTIELKAMTSARRVAETQLKAEFDSQLPMLLGGLYDLLADCLKVLPTINQQNLPRMTDYALMGIAVEKVLKLKPGLFLNVYCKNTNEQTENAFWNDDLCSAIYRKLEKAPNNRIEGTASELRKIIFDRDYSSAPRTARGLTGWLKRVESVLEMKDIIVERPPRSAHKRTIVIRSRTPMPPPKVAGFLGLNGVRNSGQSGGSNDLI